MNDEVLEKHNEQETIAVTPSEFLKTIFDPAAG